MKRAESTADGGRYAERDAGNWRNLVSHPFFTRMSAGCQKRAASGAFRSRPCCHSKAQPGYRMGPVVVHRPGM